MTGRSVLPLVPGGAITPAAPRLAASGMKSTPDTFPPGRAANRKPGWTARESAVIPVISIVSKPGRSGLRRARWVGVRFIRSIRRNAAAGWVYVDLHVCLDDRRLFVDRGNLKQWAHRGDDAVDGRRGDPAAGLEPGAV